MSWTLWNYKQIPFLGRLQICNCPALLWKIPKHRANSVLVWRHHFMALGNRWDGKCQIRTPPKLCNRKKKPGQELSASVQLTHGSSPCNLIYCKREEASTFNQIGNYNKLGKGAEQSRFARYSSPLEVINKLVALDKALRGGRDKEIGLCS